MNPTFDEICDGATAGLGKISSGSLRTPRAWTRQQIVKQALLEMTESDLRVLCANQGWRTSRREMRAFLERVKRRCQSAYGNPLILFLVFAALGEIVSLLIAWIWHKFVKDAGLSAAEEGGAMAGVVPSLNEIGWRAAA